MKNKTLKQQTLYKINKKKQRKLEENERGQFVPQQTRG